MPKSVIPEKRCRININNEDTAVKHKKMFPSDLTIYSLELNQAKESVNTMLKASAAEQSSIVQSPPTGELTAYQNPTIK
ncbi:MAG: hypothetical protein WC955_11735, partial [Elusimicrobiota bacterium]